MGRNGDGSRCDARKEEIGRTWNPITSKIGIPIVGVVLLPATLLGGRRATAAAECGATEGVLPGRARGARAGGVAWEQLVRFEVGKELVAGPKGRIIRRVVRRASARCLRGGLIRRRARRRGGGRKPVCRR